MKGKKTVVNMLQWMKTSSKYAVVKDADEDNLTAANAAKDGVEIVQALTSDWDELIDPAYYNISWDGLKFHHDLIEAEEDDLNGNKDKGITGKKKLYEDLVASKGIATANASKECADYQAAWEKLYGIAKKVTKTKDGKDVQVSFTAYTDKEVMTGYDEDGNKIPYSRFARSGYYRFYQEQYDFVKDANGKIDGADWFTIYFQNVGTDTVEPEDVVITFTDCTVAGKDLTVDKLNDLLSGWNPAFSSAKEAWFKVILDGEALTWKKTTGRYILQ